MCFLLCSKYKWDAWHGTENEHEMRDESLKTENNFSSSFRRCSTFTGFYLLMEVSRVLSNFSTNNKNSHHTSFWVWCNAHTKIDNADPLIEFLFFILSTNSLHLNRVCVTRSMALCNSLRFYTRQLNTWKNSAAKNWNSTTENPKNPSEATDRRIKVEKRGERDSLKIPSSFLALVRVLFRSLECLIHFRCHDLLDLMNSKRERFVLHVIVSSNFPPTPSSLYGRSCGFIEFQWCKRLVAFN